MLCSVSVAYLYGTRELLPHPILPYIPSQTAHPIPFRFTFIPGLPTKEKRRDLLSLLYNHQLNLFRSVKVVHHATLLTLSFPMVTQHINRPLHGETLFSVTVSTPVAGNFICEKRERASIKKKQKKQQLTSFDSCMTDSKEILK